MVDYKDLFSTTLTLEVTSKKKLVGKCILAGMDKTIAVSKSTQKKLCPDLENRKEGDVITSELLEKCFVTLCRSKGKNFWLITEFEPKRSKCLSIQNANIDVDILLSIWEKKGLEDAVFAFQNCILNGISIESFEDTDLPKPKRKKKKNVNSFIPVEFDDDLLDITSIDDSVLDLMDDIDISDIVDFSDVLNDD